jgi:hypothetical protein
MSVIDYQLRWDKETSAPNIWDADGAFGDEVALIPIILSEPLEQKRQTRVGS